MQYRVTHQFSDQEGNDLEEPFTVFHFKDFTWEGVPYGLSVAVHGLHEKPADVTLVAVERAMNLYRENHGKEN